MEENGWEDTLATRLRRHPPALIHLFHGYHSGIALEAEPLLRQFPLVLTLTGTDLNEGLTGKSRPIVLSAIQAADRVVVFHHDFQKGLADILPQLSFKTHVIPQGVALPRGRKFSKTEQGFPEDAFLVALPSGLRRVKNPALALEAVSQAYRDEPRMRLLIVGANLDPDYAVEILREVEECSWSRYLGEVPHSWMRGIFSACDAVLNTSRAEGQPQGVLEGMSIGLPGLLSDVPGNHGLLTEGREGFYFSGPSDLARKLLSLARSSQLQKTMGRSARTFVKEHYDKDEEIRQYLELYRSVVPSTPIIEP